MMFISFGKVVTLDTTDNKVEFAKSTHQLLQSITIQFLHICFQRYAKTVEGNLCIIDPREKRQDIDTIMEHVSSRSFSSYSISGTHQEHTSGHSKEDHPSWNMSLVDPSPRVWFLGKPEAFPLHRVQGNKFIPSNPYQIPFRHSSRTYFWTLEGRPPFVFVNGKSSSVFHISFVYLMRLNKEAQLTFIYDNKNSMDLLLYMAPIAEVFLPPTMLITEENVISITLFLARDDIKISCGLVTHTKVLNNYERASPDQTSENNHMR
ncbi:hypothetical protein F3Y22_tig00113123pilonHSYRG00138 [Hibiscus syriacus]|uniref:Uncharacterized protein n=1 Tax=Hibiscus syriacus TaxID=106335 RepID=A0A6A2Y3U2_HIBSY|nr:hypothetical protein F3Y22_tig00113123pilonHSYRG00138 [Hibiscus syriacus]